MVNQKGMLRIIEATIAVLIVIGALLALISKQEVGTQQDGSELLQQALNEIAKNPALREKIVSDSAASKEAENEIIGILKERIKNPKFNFNASICDAYSGPCGGAGSYPPNAGDVYTNERIITASLTKFTPKVVKIYMWQK